MDSFPLKTGNVEVKGKAKNGKVKVVKYDRSFLSRVIQSQKIKGFYDEFKNYCLSFEKVKSRPSWGAESFVVGNETVVKLIVKAGALCACYALSPSAYNQKEYPHKDCSDKREIASTPLLVPIRTTAEYKIARRLAADAFTSRFVYTEDFPARTDYLSALPMQKDDALIKKGLIKRSETEMTEAEAKKAIALALQAEAEEEKELEGIGSGKKPRKPKKTKEPTVEEPPVEEPVEQPTDPITSPAPVDEEQTDEEGVEEVVFEQDEEDTVFEIASDGLVIEIKYDRSFTARIIQNEGAKRYFSEIKNYCLSFGIKPRLSWKADSFYLGRKTYLLAKVRGKTLCLFLALDPKAYEERLYHHVDVSDKKSYEKTPMMIRIRSDLGLKKAKRLIEEMLTAAGLVKKEIEPVDYVALYPYEETEALIDKDLIKRVERKLDEEESQKVIAAGQITSVPTLAPAPEPEPEEVVFELSDEEESIAVEPELEDDAEEVVFELDDETEDDAEEVSFELAEDEEDDAEEVSFELADEEEEEETKNRMESYGTEESDGRYVTLRKYIRGFAAKMRQGDQDRKDYYAEIKAKLLSYKGVKLLESFPGESYKKGSRTLLKMRIRGKTLCLFFALNTDNYKQTVYRQQYKGDTKAYASTPMMVRVKSEQGLKRAIKLIEELERNYALREGDPVDLLAIRRECLYEETPVLVEKGMIKVRLVTVTRAEAEELLKKKAR